MMNRIKGCQGASTPPLASTSLELQLQLCKALPVSHAELHHSPACSKELLLISSDGFECGKPNDINLYTIRGWSSHGNIGNIGFTTLSLSPFITRNSSEDGSKLTDGSCVPPSGAAAYVAAITNVLVLGSHIQNTKCDLPYPLVMTNVAIENGH